MTWLRVSLFKACASTNYLPPLKMADNIIFVQHHLQRQLVRIPTTSYAAPTSPYIVHQEQQAFLSSSVKNKALVERWYLQAVAICRLANVSGTETLPEI